MAQSKSNPTVHRRGRVFSEIQWSPEKIAHWKSEKEELYQRCQLIFDRQEFDIPVHAAIGVTDILLGRKWLRNRQLLVDMASGVLTLGENQ